MAHLFSNDFEQFEVNISKSPTVTIRGRKGGNGPPLLLIHGFPQTHAIWHKVAPELAKSFTLIMPDLRGYGASSKPKSDDPNDHRLYAKDSMARDMVQTMQKLGYETFKVVGHDRGGRVAHKLCVMFPERVKKAMFLDICPTLEMYSATDQVFATAYWHWFFLIQPTPFPEDAMTGSPDVFASKMLRGLPQGSDNPQGVFDERAFAEYKALFRDKDTVHGMCEDYRAAAVLDLQQQNDDIEHGRKIKCPIRVLWGTAGLVEKKFDAPKDWQKVCEEGKVDSRSRAVKSGHYIPEEVPDELTADILEFCK